MLESLYLSRNPLGDEGLAALLAPPPKGGLTKLNLKELDLNSQLHPGLRRRLRHLRRCSPQRCALPALVVLSLHSTLASAAAIASVNSVCRDPMRSLLICDHVHDVRAEALCTEATSRAGDLPKLGRPVGVSHWP